MCTARDPVAHYYVHDYACHARMFGGINFGGLISIKNSPIRQSKISAKVFCYSVHKLKWTETRQWVLFVAHTNRRKWGLPTTNCQYQIPIQPTHSCSQASHSPKNVPVQVINTLQGLQTRLVIPSSLPSSWLSHTNRRKWGLPTTNCQYQIPIQPTHICSVMRK